MSKLLLFRHAQASFMKADYDQLSELGYQQSTVLGEYLAQSGVRMDKIYVGPLKRHWQTYEQVKAAYAKKNINLPVPILLAELDEHQAPEVLKKVIDEVVPKHEILQKWHDEGQANPKLFRKNYLKIFHHFMTLWATDSAKVAHPAEYQDWATFRAVVRQGIERIITENGSGVTVGAFTSGGTVSAAAGHALEMTNEARIIELNASVINTSFTEFNFSKGKIGLKSFNNIPHLIQPELVTYV